VRLNQKWAKPLLARQPEGLLDLNELVAGADHELWRDRGAVGQARRLVT
jgi:hypothetical protein